MCGLLDLASSRSPKMTDDATGYAGQAGLTAGNSSRNQDDFAAQQRIAGVRTMVPVKIVAVHGGGVGPAPTLDVQVLVDQTDGQGNATPHGTIYGISAPRNRSGNGEVINDPVVGDMGWMHAADRDVSSFLTANGKASPGSDRRHSLSDGVFIRGHDSKATPKQFVQFRSDGVTVMDVNGHQFETTATKVIVAPKEGSNAMVFLGGDGTKGGYDFLQTMSGPCINAKGRIS